MSGKTNIFHNYSNNNYLIETGSYYGDGITKAIEAGFKNIISIEITPAYYDLCTEKFKDNLNVKVILGDTVKILPDLLKEINEPVTYWLDAHYTDPTTNYGDKMSPLMDELEIIKFHAQSFNDVILIDDMRIFNESDWNYHNYLFNNEDIKNKIREISPDVEFSYEDGYVPNDILVAKFFVKDLEEIVVEDINLVDVKPTIEKQKEFVKEVKKTVKKTSKTKKR
jgi:hypothetical protein